jgi:hypothetical protein
LKPCSYLIVLKTTRYVERHVVGGVGSNQGCEGQGWEESLGVEAGSLSQCRIPDLSKKESAQMNGAWMRTWSGWVV